MTLSSNLSSLGLPLVAWSLVWAALLALLDRVSKLSRERVFELWSMCFYGLLSAFIAATLATSSNRLFDPLLGLGNLFVLPTMGYYAVSLVATKHYLGRPLPPSFLAHHVFFMALFAFVAVELSEAAPTVLLWFMLQQVTGVVFHLKNAVEGAHPNQRDTNSPLAQLDYVVFFLARVLFAAVLTVVYLHGLFTRQIGGLAFGVIGPAAMLVSMGFNLYWFSIKTRTRLGETSAPAITVSHRDFGLEGLRT